MSCIADNADETDEPSGLWLLSARAHGGKRQYRNTSKVMIELAAPAAGQRCGYSRRAEVWHCLWIVGVIGACAEGIRQQKRSVGPELVKDQDTGEEHRDRTRNRCKTNGIACESDWVLLIVSSGRGSYWEWGKTRGWFRPAALVKHSGRMAMPGERERRRTGN